MISSVSSKASSSTSPLPPLSPLGRADTEVVEEQKASSVTPSLSLPCWATQALCNLASSEMELRQLREQQVAEAQAVARGVERALLGAQREERRLVERVGQDHRDLQCRLEQVQRDNAAAVRVGQALVEKRLHKIAQLREQIKKTNERNAEGSKNRDEVGPTRDFLLRGVKPKDGVKFWGEKNEAILPELEEDSEQLAPVQVHLVRQFGKQGSGRADLTLPSGIHATSQGQLFLVDCGNARVQVTDQCGNVLQQVAAQNNEQGGSLRRCRNYFDVAVNTKGLIALSCAAERALHIFNRHGRLLQTYGGAPSIAGLPRDELEAPRGVTVTLKDEFLVTDIRKGTLIAMKLEPKTGLRVERTVVTGFHRPYLVTSCLHSGLVAVCERGSETGREACVKVLGPDWNTLRILGVCSAMGPVLTSPWGLCIDKEGAVLVADWAVQHRVVLYPPEGTGRVVVTEGLSSPRGLALLPSGLLVVSDSMHHCIKIYQYK
uniref:E3 ubiquitin-protein ligase TRIM32 n=1 Tax=Electrophorus electricus TaxID=8005 RepID=A0AAY5EGE0_ELEEL